MTAPAGTGGLAIGAQIGSYRIDGLLGTGGMGTVYRAQQIHLQRLVALKVMNPTLAADPDFCARFMREARAGAAIDHPHVVRIHDADIRDGILYQVFEFVPGGDLARLLATRGPLPPAEALRLIAECADGLHAIHLAGLLHRDLKPQNIFLDAKGRAKLGDLGLARSASAGENLTMTGAVMGTAAYMAPEQANGDDLDIRADIHALGGTLYTLLTGRLPFTGPTPGAVMGKVIYEPPPDPRALVPTIPAEVAALVQRAMAKRRNDRFATPEALQQEALRVAAGLPPQPTQPAADAALAPTRIPIPATTTPAPSHLAPTPATQHPAAPPVTASPTFLTVVPTQHPSAEPAAPAIPAATSNPAPGPAPTAATAQPPAPRRRTPMVLPILAMLALLAALALGGGWWWHQQSLLDTDRDAVLARIGGLPASASEADESTVAQAVAAYDGTSSGERKASVDGAWSRKLADILQVRLEQEKSARAMTDRHAQDAASAAKAAADQQARDAAAKAAADQQAPPWSSAHGQDQWGTWADLTIAGVTQRFRLIPAGTFTMGSPPEEPGHFPDETAHRVTLTKAYWMADSACTQELWQALMGANPSEFTGDPQRPVERVSWDDCQNFLSTLNHRDGRLSARLPTEAEWEYACRAGTTGPIPGNNLDALAWYLGNSGATTHPVKQKAPNPWGLYDMIGNVWQWCGDWYWDYPAGAVTDPVGAASGAGRVRRGGGWDDEPAYCRSAFRTGVGPGDRGSLLGFRICFPVQSDSNPLSTSATLPAPAPVASAPTPSIVSPAPTSVAVPPPAPVAPAPAPSAPWSSAHGQDQWGTWADLTIAGVTQRFRLIPAGTFTMGCDDAETAAAWENAEKTFDQAPRGWFVAPQHPVTLTKPFWLADSACTQALWQAVMGANPAAFHDDPQRPVEQVSWDDCQSMLAAMNKLDARFAARLPTEAEWEYACRAGTTTALPCGDIAYLGAHNAPALDPLAWYGGNSGIDDPNRLAVDAKAWLEKQYAFDRAGTHPVRLKAPNAWGLYDMIGNVWQWCSDMYGDYPSGAVTDPPGAASGSYRVIRGGCWGIGPASCRSADRSGYAPGFRGSFLGFRLCLPVQSGPKP
jgi:formylglycine-generating enzyme required for sulfatase activity/serine/threonine protein kinase